MLLFSSRVFQTSQKTNNNRRDPDGGRQCAPAYEQALTTRRRLTHDQPFLCILSWLRFWRETGATNTRARQLVSQKQ